MTTAGLIILALVTTPLFVGLYCYALSAWRNVKTHDSGRDMAMDKSTCKTSRVNTRQGGIASKTSGHPYPRKSGDYACMCHAGSNPAALTSLLFPKNPFSSERTAT